MRAIDSIARFVRFSASSLNFLRFSDVSVFVDRLAIFDSYLPVIVIYNVKYGPILTHISTEYFAARLTCIDIAAPLGQVGALQPRAAIHSWESRGDSDLELSLSLCKVADDHPPAAPQHAG